MKNFWPWALGLSAGALAGYGLYTVATRRGDFPVLGQVPASDSRLGQVDSRVAAARSLVDVIRSTGGRTEEARQKTAEFQRMMNMAQIDGLYGPKTATKVASLGVVPAAPVYWPKANTQQAVAAWNAFVARESANDPRRSEQWARARVG